MLKECGKKRELLYTAGGTVNWWHHCGKRLGGSPKKLKIELTWSSNSITGYINEEDKNANLKRYMYPNVYSSIIYL